MKIAPIVVIFLTFINAVPYAQMKHNPHLDLVGEAYDQKGTHEDSSDLLKEPVEGYKYNNAINISPAQMFLSELRIGYIRYLKNHYYSLGVNPFYISYQWDFNSLIGGGLNLQLKRYYFNQQGPLYINSTNTSMLNPFIAGDVQYSSMKKTEQLVNFVSQEFNDDYYIVEESISSVVNTLHLGTNIGIEWVVQERLFLELYGGAAYRFANVNSTPGAEFPLVESFFWARGFNGLVPRVGVTIGTTF